MEIRGIGNILGAEQHGHMISVGFDLYCDLLNEAVDKLRGLQIKEKEFECVVDLNISAYIPGTYIEDENQKVIEYKRLANVRAKNELEYILSEWKDRFGKLPQEVTNLIKIVELRVMANELDIKHIKSESSTNEAIRMFVNLRLDNWLKLQAKLPQELKSRIAFKGEARGSSGSSYLLIKTGGYSVEKQLDMLFYILEILKPGLSNQKVA